MIGEQNGCAAAIRLPTGMLTALVISVLSAVVEKVRATIMREHAWCQGHFESENGQ
jgi:hypothetical protein